MVNLVDLPTNIEMEFEQKLKDYITTNEPLKDVKICVVIESNNEVLKFYNIYNDDSVGIGVLSNLMERYILQRGLRGLNIPIVRQEDLDLIHDNPT